MSEKEITKKLTPEEHRVLRESGTEKPFTSPLLTEKRSGEFRCKVCDNLLFNSTTKFESGSGWPSFTDVANNDSVTLREDGTLGMRRVEVRCAKCDSHLGHVFPDGPVDQGGQRYCINGVCLAFSADEKNNEEVSD